MQRARCGKKVDEALALALKTVAALEIPHVEVEYEASDLVH
jgi:hypothetical protein